MQIIMAGLDHSNAGVAVRETFSIHEADLATIVRGIHRPPILGCAVISTCNRTELYLSYDSNEEPDPVALLAQAKGLEAKLYRRYFTIRSGRQAVEHLMRVASGMQSLVLGDDQIITQVRSAIETARETGTTDATLEAAFRAAITAGKRIKNCVRFARDGQSVATAALEAVKNRIGPLVSKKALVIGNGIIGRLVAEQLRAEKVQVTVTIRTHRQSAPPLPDGCLTVAYENRYQAMAGCDLVVSATSSPHHTVNRTEFDAIGYNPPLLVDLAIPRDIDPTLSDRPGLTLWNVDDIGPGGRDSRDADCIAQAEDIIAEETRRYEVWRKNRALRANPATRADFPIFINLHGRTVVVVGGGKVAARRSGVLLGFGAVVRVIAPKLGPEMKKLTGNPNLVWLEKEYEAGDMRDAILAIAATDNRATNRAVGIDAAGQDILVSVADNHEECTFYFPAVIRNEFVTAGLISNHGDHVLVRQTAARIRREVERLDENHSSWNPVKPSGHGPDDADYPVTQKLSS